MSMDPGLGSWMHLAQHRAPTAAGRAPAKLCTSAAPARSLHASAGQPTRAGQALPRVARTSSWRRSSLWKAACWRAACASSAHASSSSAAQAASGSISSCSRSSCLATHCLHACAHAQVSHVLPSALCCKVRGWRSPQLLARVRHLDLSRQAKAACHAGCPGLAAAAATGRCSSVAQGRSRRAGSASVCQSCSGAGARLGQGAHVMSACRAGWPGLGLSHLPPQPPDCAAGLRRAGT